jgi:parallel beta-helix repeat protein
MTILSENTDIRDAGKAGIWVEPGRARVTLRDSRISGGTKAVYLQAGARLDATGNTIMNNSEEGIDIRQNTRGTIKNNTIENNRESGIEVIIGSSDFVITGNSIKNNGASGIASQFYPLNKKLGKIVVTNNTLKGNKNYDLDCKLPQGGNFPPGYWSDSISLEGNTLSAPDGSSLNKRCKILQTGTKEELEALAQSEAEQAEQKEETEERLTEAENNPGEVVLPNQDEVAKREQFIQEMQESPSQQWPSLDEKLKQRSSFIVFFVGYDQTLVKEYQQTLEQQKTWLADKKTAIASQETLASDEQIQGLIQQQEADIKLQEERALVYTQERGIWNNKALRSLFTKILLVSVG